MKAAPKGRIIFVSSMAHKWGNMDVGNMNCEKYFNPGKIYFNSKMANVMTANNLAKQLDGTGNTKLNNLISLLIYIYTLVYIIYSICTPYNTGGHVSACV